MGPGGPERRPTFCRRAGNVQRLLTGPREHAANPPGRRLSFICKAIALILSVFFHRVLSPCTHIFSVFFTVCFHTVYTHMGISLLCSVHLFRY